MMGTVDMRLLCECGHDEDQHVVRGPCAMCLCDNFVALLDDPASLVSTRQVAKQVGVPTAWVRANAQRLMGVKVGRYWVFPAVAVSIALGILTDRASTVVYRCPTCEGETVVRKGVLRTEVIEINHLPGMCHG